MNKETIGLYLLIFRLLQHDRSLGRATILPLAEIKLPGVTQNYDVLVQKLFDQQLTMGDAQSFRLTLQGLDRVREAAGKYSLNDMWG